jgi:hypothetical protein
MSKHSDREITFRLSRFKFSIAFLFSLSASAAISAPLNIHPYASISECEAQYRQCLKKSESGYTRHKVSCERSFRQCQRSKSS